MSALVAETARFKTGGAAMLRHFPATIIWLTLSMTLVLAQAPFTPRNADEAYAWQLHNQYIESRQRVARLATLIRQRTAETLPGRTAKAIELQRLEKQLSAEIERQHRLEALWKEEFYARYGDLRDSAETIYEPNAGRALDRIEFRLINFPFHRNDGVYTGTIRDVPGEITLLVDGTSVVGNINGLYFYRVGSLVQTDEFIATIDGTITAGVIQAKLSGKLGQATLTGSLTGTINKDAVIGRWSAVGLTVECGTFRAARITTAASDSDKTPGAGLFDSPLLSEPGK